MKKLESKSRNPLQLSAEGQIHHHRDPLLGNNAKLSKSIDSLQRMEARASEIQNYRMEGGPNPTANNHNVAKRIMNTEGGVYQDNDLQQS